MGTSFRSRKPTSHDILVNFGASVNPDFRESERRFLAEFPDNDVCLNYLLKLRFGTYIACPKCARSAKFHKIRQIPAYACQWCGYHLHPMAQTRFARSRVGLHTWFHAIFLFSNVDSGITARQLQSLLGLTYKTAWRMRNMIIDARYELPLNWKQDDRVDFEMLLGALIAPREKKVARVNKDGTC